MKTSKLFLITLLVVVLSACTTDEIDPDGANSGMTEQEAVEEITNPSEEPTPQPEMERDTAVTENTTVSKHFYELTFSGGPMNGMTLSDSVAIEKGYTIYSDADGPEVLVIVIKKDDVFLNAHLTRFGEAEEFPIIRDNQIQDRTAAHLFFSFVPPGPSGTAYVSESGVLELSDFEIYSLQGLDMAMLKIDFEGSFAYGAPPNDPIPVLISGRIIIEQIQFDLPDIALPD